MPLSRLLGHGRSPQHAGTAPLMLCRCSGDNGPCTRNEVGGAGVGMFGGGGGGGVNGAGVLSLRTLRHGFANSMYPTSAASLSCCHRTAAALLAIWPRRSAMSRELTRCHRPPWRQPGKAVCPTVPPETAGTAWRLVQPPPIHVALPPHCAIITCPSHTTKGSTGLQSKAQQKGSIAGCRGRPGLWAGQRCARSNELVG